MTRERRSQWSVIPPYYTIEFGCGQWSNYTERSKGAHGERGARVCNGGLGSMLPVGTRGKAPGQGGGADEF